MPKLLCQNCAYSWSEHYYAKDFIICPKCNEKYIFNPAVDRMYSVCKNRFSLMIHGQTKALPDNCEICGENRVIDKAHIMPASDYFPRGETSPKYYKNPVYLKLWGNYENYFSLCPTHHRLFDRNLLSIDEFNKLQLAVKTKQQVIQDYLNIVRYARQTYLWVNGKKRGTLTDKEYKEYQKIITAQKYFDKKYGFDFINNNFRYV
ncbi:putative endonuclease [Candidatus Termititenax aidoneus]|uniref:Endonuclease n=1 Tax=Termititenax aidoneus TaxID=2218524 RepID=A0A388TCK0_TERA1|nr:putative endonuclease [Candidatus Termititenax aidoneus]